MNNQKNDIYRKLQTRVLISTQNIDIGGGVGALIRFLGLYLRERGYKITYMFPSRCIPDMLNHKHFQHREVVGIPAIQIRSIPYVILFDQLISAFSIRKMLKNYEIYQAIGGANLPAIPFMLERKPYLIWVATTIKDEDELIFNPLHPFEFSPRMLLYYINYIFRPLAFGYEKRIYKKAAKILTISQYTAESIKKQYSISAKKITVIPFPIDTDKFRAVSGTRIMKEKFILMVGRIKDPRKNIKLLLYSFTLIKQHFPELKLVIVGQKPKDRSFEKFCAKLGIDKSVIFPGHISEYELIKYYTQAELFVLSSLQEGLSIVVLESMSCGTPVVSTKCGGPEEIITHGENGYLVENNNVEALADGVCKLLSDDELRIKMGEKAREHICREYSMEVIKPKFLEIYKEVYPHLFEG